MINPTPTPKSARKNRSCFIVMANAPPNPPKQKTINPVINTFRGVHLDTNHPENKLKGMISNAGNVKVSLMTVLLTSGNAWLIFASAGDTAAAAMIVNNDNERIAAFKPAEGFASVFIIIVWNEPAGTGISRAFYLRSIHHIQTGSSPPRQRSPHKSTQTNRIQEA